MRGIIDEITERLGPISVLVANAVQWPLTRPHCHAADRARQLAVSRHAA